LSYASPTLPIDARTPSFPQRRLQRSWSNQVDSPRRTFLERIVGVAAGIAAFNTARAIETVEGDPPAETNGNNRNIDRLISL